MQLKKYQEDAIAELLDKSKKLLARTDGQKIVFKAPTGSGKTIMTAEYIKRLVDDREVNITLAFVWTAPRKLHQQSKEKLEAYYQETRALECVNFEDLSDRQIGENEILFLNWESINKKDKNTIVKENEQEFYLSKIIENTKDAGREVLLIVDESHYHDTEIADQLKDMLGARLTIDVSATPEMKNINEIVEVPLESVKLDAMIKKSVVLNPDFDNVLSGNRVKSALADGADTLVLKHALEKRHELAKAYKQAGVEINPLLLIQLPDKKTGVEDFMKDQIQKILKDEHSISVENGKLAIYLSEEKENLVNISMNDNQTQVMIFKQAIALGWDCPRAQVLVLFRDWKSLEFSIQTVGRIMRMPEPDSGYYDDEILNHAYVYTNLANIQIYEDMARSYIWVFSAKRSSEYQNIGLDTYYRKRQREKTRLSPLFTKIFMRVAQVQNLKSNINSNNQKVWTNFISEFSVADVDSLVDKKIEGNKSVNVQNLLDLQKLFDYFARKSLSPEFYPDDRSVGRIKETIYAFFGSWPNLTNRRQEEIINIVLSKDNSELFNKALIGAKLQYIEETRKKPAQFLIKHNWEVPKKLQFGPDAQSYEFIKSAVVPFYSGKLWKSEEAFIKYLENTQGVKWWFKNGDRDATFFAVPYEENGEQKLFYVDFVVQFDNGYVGLFDPHGTYLSDFEAKTQGLKKYIMQQTEKGKKLIGGIVANTDQTNYAGYWMCHRNFDISYHDLSKWDVFDVLLDEISNNH